ncbi:TOMM precursor leader peptide-binding protein [Kitasatospora sp. NBC_01287]|uniref:TOMM precursor leader peptide-binding protein n=1 Tax=Kitasatospora sp. NBC_01287 TaxID=2903573 RepID=UPI00225AD414|nr:TOMM precursor leader peptide-binding protein [Kitasatospora sp. NBC_01287]MCX4745735.1 TOMM precursor leader peptide-binding protein [Kitasatospora sp. NBC_01287]
MSTELIERPGPAGAVATGLWAATRARLAERLPVPPELLGVRDELAVTEPPADPAPVLLYGHHAILGPGDTGGPDGTRTPCPRCLARRWQAVRSGPLREALELGGGGSEEANSAADTPAGGTRAAGETRATGETRAVGEPPWAVPFVADALAALATLLTDRQQSGSSGRVHLLDLETLRVSGFPLLPDAQCPHCDPRTDDSAEAARLTLRARPKRALDDFRRRPVQEYGLSLPALVNPVTGMLGPSVVPDLVSGSTSSTVGCFTLRSGSYLREAFWGGHSADYRGSTEVGLLEGLERYAGMRPRGRRTTVRAAFAELAGQAVDPRECGLYDAEFHRLQPGIRPFEPDRPIPWVWGWSLRDERPLLVPEILSYYHAPGGVANRFVQESSNGCASGGCLEEAIYFGLMEVIERDAFLLAWYGQLALPELDVRSSTRPQTRAMVDRLELHGYRARFFDTRISFPIPVVTAVAERIDGGLGRLCFGAGASLDPEAALAAGLCEIATDAVNLRRRTAREERRLRAMAADFDQVRVLHDHPLLYGLPEMARYADFLLRAPDGGSAGGPITAPAARSAGAPGARSGARSAAGSGAGPGAIRPGPDLREDLRHCVEAVAARGFDVVVVDQTMPEQRALGLHTVSVLVPGLLPIDFGRRRQRALTMPRLRTAPREAGLRGHDLRDEDLNPAPHPFP